MPGGVKVHLGGENIELSCLPGASSMYLWILDRSCKDAATSKSRVKKSQEQWLAP